jgi:4-diphosphocytidyl-2-C-methyl-D-erythritol kinase
VVEGVEHWRGHAPAKVNLTLRILGARPDGYHELDTLMVLVDWVDDVEIDVLPGGERRIELDVNGDEAEGIPTERENLAWKAAALFMARTGWDHGVRIRLWKRIPSGAGLGGGSSDAGAVLRGMCAITGHSPTQSELQDWAAELGSDVPFFVSGSSAALCRGRGEIVESCENGLIGSPIVIVFPGFASSTQAAYKGYRKALSRSSPDSKIVVQSLESGRLNRVADQLGNDLAGSVMRKFPFLGLLREELERAGALGASLSGSGSALYGLFSDFAEATAVGDDLRGRLGPAARVHAGRIAGAGI